MTITYFDYLPTQDIIHEFIMSFLDYDSRIQLNMSLPPAERLCRRLPKQKILAHEMRVQAYLMTSQLECIDGYDVKKKRCQRLCTLLDGLRVGNRPSTVIEHSPSFRETVIKKIREINDNSTGVIRCASPYFKKKIRNIASKLSDDIAGLPPATRIVSRPIEISTDGILVFTHEYSSPAKS
jgi:hypothetical protein